MKTIELFAGSRSFSKVAAELGHETFTVDNKQWGNIDYVGDIMEYDIRKYGYINPDIIWASPPCTGFSVAAIGHHWTGGKGAYIPKTETAKLGIKLVQQTIKIINNYKQFSPGLKYYIENPRGVLRKLGILDSAPFHHTITYCQYGDERMKPTDIWTNDPNWKPRPMCKNGAPCHVAAPRGSRTGTQGLKGAYDRSRIPAELFKEIFNQYET